MVRKRRRHTATDKLQVASEALEGSETICQCLKDRTPAEEHCVLRRWQPVLCRSVLAAYVQMNRIFPVLWSEVEVHFSVGERVQSIRISGGTLD